MTLSLATALLLGLLFGVRHAFEPDHLAAVSTLVTARGTRKAGAVLGAVWGVGHTLALLIVGSALAVLDARLPASLVDGFEFLVAVMLVTLGTRAIVRARTSHAHSHEPSATTSWTSSASKRQPLAVGLVHGLAGSGALTALVMAEMPTVATRVAYMTLFGVGSIVGMASLTGIVGWPLARLGGSLRFARGLSLVTGTFSLMLGAWWGWSVVHGHVVARG